jgi:hypothetical protein
MPRRAMSGLCSLLEVPCSGYGVRLGSKGCLFVIRRSKREKGRQEEEREKRKSERSSLTAISFLNKQALSQMQMPSDISLMLCCR